jgi:hypothetical protein
MQARTRIIAIAITVVLAHAALGSYAMVFEPAFSFDWLSQTPQGSHHQQLVAEANPRETARASLVRALRDSQDGAAGLEGQATQHFTGSEARQHQAQATQAPAETVRPSNLPGEAQLTILIRTTIIALNQANRTNNYSVLHDLGSPNFQAANSPDRLRELFSALRERDLDLGPIMVISPRLFREPSIDERGRLRLAGFFPSQPEQVNFDLAFEMVEGEWRLFGIGVNTSRVDQPAIGGPG